MWEGGGDGSKIMPEAQSLREERASGLLLEEEMVGSFLNTVSFTLQEVQPGGNVQQILKILK